MEEQDIILDDEQVSVEELYDLNTATLESVYPTKTVETREKVPAFDYKATSYPAPAVKTAKPKVLIPVFPGTNCEYDSARAVLAAGAEADIAVIRNLTADDVARSVENVAKRIAEQPDDFHPRRFLRRRRARRLRQVYHRFLPESCHSGAGHEAAERPGRPDAAAFATASRRLSSWAWCPMARSSTPMIPAPR